MVPYCTNLYHFGILIPHVRTPLYFFKRKGQKVALFTSVYNQEPITHNVTLNFTWLYQLDITAWSAAAAVITVLKQKGSTSSGYCNSSCYFNLCSVWCLQNIHLSVGTACFRYTYYAQKTPPIGVLLCVQGCIKVRIVHQTSSPLLRRVFE